MRLFFLSVYIFHEGSKSFTKLKSNIYTSQIIADKLRTVSSSNDINPTGVVKSVYWFQSFIQTAKVV